MAPLAWPDLTPEPGYLLKMGVNIAAANG